MLFRNMALTLRGGGRGGGGLHLLRSCWTLLTQHVNKPLISHTGVQIPGRHVSSHSVKLPSSLVPETSLSRPPWPELTPIDPEEERLQHAAVVQKVNGLLAQGDYGRLFAVVHFASRQWKVTNEDLILIENHIEAECGDRIHLEKVLMVGGEDFTMIGRPILGRNLVRVEATVIEKTESWPKVHMRFWKRHRFQKKRIVIQPQTILRINSIEVAPRLS